MIVEPHAAGAGEEHPEVVEISALIEGIGPVDRLDQVRTHLSGCVICTEVRQSLEEIRGLLGRLPGPPQMPADVAGRIDAALAAETVLAAQVSAGDAELTAEERAVMRALLDDTPDDSAYGAEDSGYDDLPEGSGWSAGEDPGIHLNGHLTAASADVRAAGVARQPAARTHPPSTGPQRHSPGGPGRKQRSQASRWTRRAVAATCAAAVIGVGVFLINDLPGADTDGAPQANGTKKTPSSQNSFRRTYTDETLTPLVQRLLATAGGVRPAEPTPSQSSDSLGSGRPSTNPLIAPEAKKEPPRASRSLPSCVLDAVADVAGPPLATEAARYQGTPVGVVVMPQASDIEHVTVFLVDSSCESTAPANPGKVLLRRSVPRQ